ncbi:MAG: phosphoribosylglycinamide formyltransferase [Spirochaetes bacterium GWB1_48_6]|nr:MAG: phosphoribosylglycinamide formyltransferase [Spirochaetes bacterium GWB1_48_6]
MANIAVLASGSGTNFQKIGEFFQGHKKHKVKLMLCDRKAAGVFSRAINLGIPAIYIPYFGRDKSEVESDITQELEKNHIDLVVLAGFMRILSEDFVNRWHGKVVNIHPSLLPRHPGAHGILDSWSSNDGELGISIHWVDQGMDTGSIIRQKAFTRTPGMSLKDTEQKIHALEYEVYPQVILELCDTFDKKDRK